MTTQEIAPPPPAVMWAQRSGVVLVTINLEDCKSPDIKLEKQSVYFRGVGGTDHKLYEVTIPLHKEIDPEKSKIFHRDRCIELVLAKASMEGAYWPTLTSDKQKHHWLKCDFNKWQDEDESGDESNMAGGDFEEMMRQMGGLGAGGAGGEKPSFDDVNGGSTDSDDEELPDLE